MKVKETCCACRADFKKAVGELVDEGILTPQEHKQKEAEVNAAFGANHAAAGHAAGTGHPAAHDAGHAHAGTGHDTGHEHPHEGMSRTLAGTHEHHRIENARAQYHDQHYHSDRPIISPEHHRLHHEAHHQAHNMKK